MEKRAYYVTVATADSNAHEQTPDFEFEITATDAEMEELQALFSDDPTNDANPQPDGASGANSAREKLHEWHDGSLTDVYRKLYELGTPATRARIEQMGVLRVPTLH